MHPNVLPAPMNPAYDFKRLKSLISLDHILCAYGLTSRLRRRDHRLFGPCPLHNGDNPTAFRADLQRGIWHCFTSCGGGDAVALIRKIENCSYRDAARLLKRLCEGMEPRSPFISPSAPDSRFRPFTLRIPLNPVVSFLQKNKAITIETAVRFETGVTERSAFLKRAVAVRLHDIHGNPIGYCGRRLDPIEIEKWGKWRFPRYLPKSNILFNAHRAACFRHQGIIVVECPWGVMRLGQAGFPNAVALLGTSLSSAQAEWLEKAPSILLMLDGDAAGRKGAEHIAASFPGKTKVVIHHLPDGCDPDDLSDRQLRSVVDQYRFFSL